MREVGWRVCAMRVYVCAFTCVCKCACACVCVTVCVCAVHVCAIFFSPLSSPPLLQLLPTGSFFVVAGIMQLLRMAEPRAVLLVHGERGKMGVLKARITRELGIPCYDPPNGATVSIPTRPFIPVDISRKLLKRGLNSSSQESSTPSPFSQLSCVVGPQSKLVIQGIISLSPTKVQVLDPKEAGRDILREGNEATMTSPTTTTVVAGDGGGVGRDGSGVHAFKFLAHLPLGNNNSPSSTPITISALHAALTKWLADLPIELSPIQNRTQPASGSVVTVANDATISLRTLRIALSERTVDAEWEWPDESLAMYVLCVVRKLLQDFDKRGQSVFGVEEDDGLLDGKPDIMCYD